MCVFHVLLSRCPRYSLQITSEDTLLFSNQETKAEMLALSNQRNQSYVNAHHDDSMETLVADLAAARQETLNLLELFTDEQLAAHASLSFAADRTAGDLFAANAQHAAVHMMWIEEGFRQGL